MVIFEEENSLENQRNIQTLQSYGGNTPHKVDFDDCKEPAATSEPDDYSKDQKDMDRDFNIMMRDQNFEQIHHKHIIEQIKQMEDITSFQDQESGEEE